MNSLENISDERLLELYVFSYTPENEDELITELRKRRLLDAAVQLFDYCHKAFNEKLRIILMDKRIKEEKP